MADALILTPAPIYVTSDAYQDVNSITNIGAYDQVDVLLNLISTAGGGTLTVYFLTGIIAPTNASDINWTNSVALTVGNVAATAANTFQAVSLPAAAVLGRYMRWYAKLTGGMTSATFTMAAMGRRKGS